MEGYGRRQSVLGPCWVAQGSSAAEERGCGTGKGRGGWRLDHIGPHHTIKTLVFTPSDRKAGESLRRGATCV